MKALLLCLFFAIPVYADTINLEATTCQYCWGRSYSEQTLTIEITYELSQIPVYDRFYQTFVGPGSNIYTITSVAGTFNNQEVTLVGNKSWMFYNFPWLLEFSVEGENYNIFWDHGNNILEGINLNSQPIDWRVLSAPQIQGFSLNTITVPELNSLFLLIIGLIFCVIFYAFLIKIKG